MPIQRLASSLSAIPQILLHISGKQSSKKLLRDGLFHRTLLPKCRPSTENSDSCGTRLLSDRERATGIEPAYPAWNAGVLAVVLCPLTHGMRVGAFTRSRPCPPYCPVHFSSAVLHAFHASRMRSGNYRIRTCANIGICSRRDQSWPWIGGGAAPAHFPVRKACRRSIR